MKFESPELSEAPRPVAPRHASPWRHQLAFALLGRRGREADGAALARSSRHGVWRALLRNPSACAGLVLLLAFAVLAVLAPRLYPGDPLDMVGAPFEWPGSDPQFWLGTDSLGRDVASEQ